MRTLLLIGWLLVWARPVLAGTLLDQIAVVINHEVLTAREVREASHLSLSKLIETRLQLQLASRRGLEARPEGVEEGEGTGDSAEVREQVMIQRLQASEILRGLIVEDQEVRHYYETHQQEFFLPKEVQLTQILLRLPEPPTSTDILNAMTAAHALRERLTSGEDFSELARRASQGPERARGGVLGWFHQGELLPELAAEAAALAVGEVGHPVHTPMGIHLLKVLDRRGSRSQPFDEVAPMIEAQLMEQRALSRQHSWLSELRRSAHIEIKY